MPRRTAFRLSQCRLKAFGATGLALLPLLLAIPTAYAATTQAQIDAARNKGLAWLLTHQGVDGRSRGVAGTEFAATAAGIEAFNKAGAKGFPFSIAVAWLSNAEPPSVDALTRKILALKLTNLDVTSHAQKLVAWRNTQFTWGAYDRFEPSIPDTLFALAALRTSSYSSRRPSARSRMASPAAPSSPPRAGGGIARSKGNREG